MGKRNRSKVRKEVVVEESASENSSKQTSPVSSDSEDDERSPPSKKSKTENGGSKRLPKSSAEICEQFGLNDVELEYTVADYQNLTNYGLFVRMVRPQVAAANERILSSRMVQLMEAKWREFRESNPLTKKKVVKEEEEKKVEKKKPEKKPREPTKKKKAPEKAKAQPKKRVKKMVLSSDDADSNNGDVSEEDAASTDNEHEETTPKQKAGGLKIRLPVFTPKTSSAKKSGRKSSKKKLAAVDSDDDDESMASSSKKSSRVATPISRQHSDTNDESSMAEEVSDEETPPKRNRSQPKRKSRVTKKTVQAEAEAEEEAEADEDSSAEEHEPESDSDFPSPGKKPPKPRSHKKREKTPDEDFDAEAEGEDEEPEDDEEASEVEEEPVKKKKKKKPEPIPIPGERKSERSRKSMSSLMTDKEFEKMLKEEAAEKKKQELAEGKKRSGRKKKKSKKGYWQEDDKSKDKDKDNSDGKEGIDESDDHYWYCEVCKDGGDLLLCDTCPKSWHKDCAKLEGEVPEGEWSCPKCKGTYESESEEEADHHDLYCKVCKDGGDVLLCDFCKLVYHPKCINPPLKEIPDGEWKCPRCVMVDFPMKARIKKILFWRWSHQLSPTDELDHTQSPQKKAAAQAAEVEQNEKEAHGATPVKRPERLFLCKFEYHSFWDCEWIPELRLEVHAPLQFHGLKRKWDLDEPPMLEDGSSWGRHRRKASASSDPYNLEEKYYRYGVKPDWLQIHRIINHEGKEGSKSTRYLVKWRDLGYEDCTWEQASEMAPGLEVWDKHYKQYWERRKERLKPTKEKKKPKKADLKKKWDKQADYITATGGTLHPYQLEGVNWMRFSWAQDTNIILADEMGLGKTIQAITILYLLWKEGYSRGPFLISAPLSTVPNWEREFEFWAPDMYVVTYGGHKDARSVMREHEFSYDPDPFHHYAKAGRMRSGARPKFDVLLSSYEMVNVDNTALSSISWEMLIVDEAHRLKSQQSLFFQTLSKYKIAFKLLLTGTPLQNNLEELFNLLNFLQPDIFSDMDHFLSEFSDINKDEQVTKLHDMLAPHMLRRLKLDVLTDLPTKSELLVRVELAAMQKKFYKHILTKNYEALNVRGYANSTSLMNIMMDLRKCCNHPYLFPAAEREAPLTSQGLYEGKALIKACGKVELLSKMLRQLKAGGHRVLIFSQMTRALDILEDWLAFEQYGYERIDGSITGKLRQESIDRFNTENSESFVFLLSTKAGGLGINLATADTVIIYDMDWNPHNDIQALSRAHRIGQKNRVMIYRFVSRNTVEERITEVAKKKMMLTELVIHRGMGSEKQESITKKEVSDILKFGAEDLFKDKDEGSVVWNDEAIKKLLDRTQEGDIPDSEGDKESDAGMNKYLRSFNVASYHVKANEGDEEDQDDEEDDEEKEEDEQDDVYWQRVLGDSYQEHKVQMLQQEEEIARSLGKGKRIRRQVNYAEIDRTVKEARYNTAEKEKEAKRKVVVEEEEEEDRIEEETKYMSDYEPDEDETSEEELDDDRQAMEPRSDPEDGEWTQDKAAPKKAKKVPPPEAEVKKGGKSKGTSSTELPPLLAKVNGHTEVLGFTARQRRAFLDAVMRYGMPPEDGHQTQWLVRDLRNKSEKVFRAYVSLFMRHLCEAVTDNAEKFSDGVPREGLSRQHVLTRIGIIALIRRKVQEFEEMNGTDSLLKYKKKEVEPILIEENADSETKNKEKGTESEETDKVKEEANSPSGEGKKEDSDDADVKEDDKKVKTEDGEEGRDDDKEENKGEDVKVTDDKKETKKPDLKSEGGKDAKDEAMEVDEEDEMEDAKSAHKKKDLQQVDGAADDSGSSSDEAEDGDKDPEDKSDEEQKSGGDRSEEDEDETGTTTESGVAKGDDKADRSSEEKMKVGTRAACEKRQDKDDTMSVSDEEGEKRDSEKGEKKEDGKMVKGKNSRAKKSADKEEDNEKDGDSDKKTVKEEDKSKASDTENESAEKNTSEAKEKPDEKKDAADEKKKDKVKLVVDLRKQAWELRRIFYIADGGFTELHALWQYEEQQLKPGREYETWHRRHDYWLLAGIITHGYRHWQDILNDPRFEMLNRAFQSDAEKMRKAAFLNRRFQLLEQALVIEEQLHKAVLHSQELHTQLRKNCRGELDAYAELDQLAILLRQIARRGATQDPHLAKVLAQLESLVGDIKHSTNSVVPATLARAPGVVIRQQQQQQQQQQQAAAMRAHSGTRPGQSRTAQQAVIPRHMMDQQRRNTPSPSSKNPTVITLE